MGPSSYIVLLQDPRCDTAELEAKLAEEHFCVRISPDGDLLAQMAETEPSAILLSGALDTKRLEQIVQELRQDLPHVPVIVVYPGPEAPVARPPLSSLDGVCYANMPAADLAVLLRGAVRTSITVRELVESNRRLNEISITDSLTGLYNRGYMTDRLNLEYKRAGRNGETLSCVMIDLDHFKQINDTYGHKFGDVILSAVAERLQGLIRETDLFGRYGGEEFLIILPNTNLEGAAKLADKLRSGLEAEMITYEFFSLLVTASFGVASSEAAEVITADHLLQLSDRALYRAKESGRNRVCVVGNRETPQDDEPLVSSERRGGQHKPRIDVVSASPEGSPRIQAMKQWEEYEISLHSTQERFLDSFKKSPPDLLVLDYPPEGEESNLDAFALCKRIKRQTQDLFIPLVFFLPRSDEALREEALQHGADDVIMYELEACELLQARLDSLLHLKALHDRWRGTYRDLTLARARLIKAERLTALGEMASGVAHDFNNVLSAVLGRTQILRRRVSDPEILRSLDVIEKAANDGAATIRRIQDFSRSTSDRVYETVDMAEVIQDCIQMTRTRWKDHAESLGIHYDFQTAFPGPLFVRGNPTELREVITNLVINALDAMPAGGQVRFEGRIAEDKVFITVQDNGIGMDEEVLKRAFDPFFSTKKEEGSGLGLSVAYGILLRHKGRIECSSAKGEGTLFRIELPHEVAQAPRTSVPNQEAAANLPVLNILVVDDEAPIREIFREALETDGHHVFVAETGPAALEILEKEPIDLLFTDLSMPEMSGWEVAHRTKKISPGTVIVLTSGWGKDFNQKQLTQHGVSHVLPKPVPFDTLQRLVRLVAREKAGHN